MCCIPNAEFGCDLWPGRHVSLRITNKFHFTTINISFDVLNTLQLSNNLNKISFQSLTSMQIASSLRWSNSRTICSRESEHTLSTQQCAYTCTGHGTAIRRRQLNFQKDINTPPQSAWFGPFLPPTPFLPHSNKGLFLRILVYQVPPFY